MMINFGFQTYTWQMSFEKYSGKLLHIADVVSKTGLKYIEAEICMLGDYFHSPLTLKNQLIEKGISFVALCLVSDWLYDGLTDEEERLALKSIEFLKCFPNAVFVLCQMPQRDRENLMDRQRNAIKCINHIGEMAKKHGITAAFHPNSPSGSVFRTQEDYAFLLNHLDFNYVGFAPDSGHILKGKMDVYEVFNQYKNVIKLVHFKDMDGNENWTAMGNGITDFSKLLKILECSNYNGYIMVEEESENARNDPDEVTLENGKYINKLISDSKE